MRAQQPEFISSELFPPTLGGVAPYDAACNRLATAAGINNNSRDGYLALMSDASSSVLDRLRPGVRGWSRMDGKPFGDTMEGMLGGAILRSIVYDEHTEAAGDEAVMTGMRDGGILSSHCENWTGGGFDYMLGVGAHGTPSSWLSGGVGSCAAPGLHRVICVGNVETLPIALPGPQGKKMWVTSSGFDLGSSTPDEVCEREKPAGVDRVAALVATTTRSASELLDATANYVRVDGQLVGTGDRIKRVSGPGSKLELDANVWQTASGENVKDSLSYVWTGAIDIGSRGTADTTCGNWTNTALTGFLGTFQSTTSEFWTSPLAEPCARYTAPYPVPHLYCVEL